MLLRTGCFIDFQFILESKDICDFLLETELSRKIYSLIRTIFVLNYL